MSADLLRRAAEAERVEWGSAESRRTYPTSSAIHLALADWLDAESGHDFGPTEHALTVAQLILGEVTP